MGVKGAKKEKITFIIATVMLDGAFEIGDPLGDGFRALVSVVRTPQLDVCVKEALEFMGASEAVDADRVEGLYAAYTRW